MLNSTAFLIGNRLSPFRKGAARAAPNRVRRVMLRFYAVSPEPFRPAPFNRFARGAKIRGGKVFPLRGTIPIDPKRSTSVSKDRFKIRARHPKSRPDAAFPRSRHASACGLVITFEFRAAFAVILPAT